MLTAPDNTAPMPTAALPGDASPRTSESPETSAGTIARQAIVDTHGKVYGYELFDRSGMGQGHDALSDAQVLLTALTHPETASLMGKRTIFVNCAVGSLGSDHLHLVQPDRVVLEMSPVPGDDATAIEAALPALEAVRARGFKLAFGHHVLKAAYQRWLPQAAFIKIDLRAVKSELVEPAIKAAQKRSAAQIIVEKIETAEQHAQVRALGVQLFQGFWFARPVMVAGKTIQPAHAVIIQLINAVRRQATPDQIEEVLKRDATLAFTMLRYINSSGFGLRTEITSFRQAVMMLGLDKLYRWAALLLTLPRAGGAPAAVGATAIVRGRLTELLAAELLPPQECDDAFVTGVFSLLDTMLGVPMDKAIAAVPLPTPITDALLHRRGPLAPFLELAIACESQDDVAFARLAQALHLSSHQVNWAHLQALAWAETVGN